MVHFVSSDRLLNRYWGLFVIFFLPPPKLNTFFLLQIQKTLFNLLNFQLLFRFVHSRFFLNFLQGIHFKNFHFHDFLLRFKFTVNTSFHLITILINLCIHASQFFLLIAIFITFLFFYIFF